MDDGENRVAAIKVGLKAGGRNVGVAGNPAATDDLNDGEAVGLGARGLEDVECERGAKFAAVDDIFGAGVGRDLSRGLGLRVGVVDGASEGEQQEKAEELHALKRPEQKTDAIVVHER